MNIEEIADWNLVVIDNVVLVSEQTNAGFQTINGHKMKVFPNRRYHGLVLKITGKCVYTINNRYSVQTGPGSITYLPMGQPYTVDALEPGSCYCVNFHIQENTELPCFSYQVRNYRKWDSLFSDLLRAWTYRTPGSRSLAFSLVYKMFAVLAEDCSARYLPARQRADITRIVERLDDETGFPSIADLAAECGMSETYFRKIFKAIYGTSPKQFLLDSRFRQAKALLATTDTAIAEIATRCDFENVYSFSRAFRNREGISPSQYRNNNQG